MYPLLEHLIVAIVVFVAAGAALRKWWPSKKRAAGCGGCGSCGNPDDTGCGTSGTASSEVKTVSMPQRRGAAR